MVTKVFGSRSVSVQVSPLGSTWRCHIEQLRPCYGAEEDADPGEVHVQVSSMVPVPVPPLAEVVASTSDAPALSVPAAEATRIPAKPMWLYCNPCPPTGSDYTRDIPRSRTALTNPQAGDNFTSQ